MAGKFVKSVVLGGGIATAVAGTAAAESNNPFTPQYNGVIVGTGVRNVPREPLVAERLFGFSSDKKVSVIAIDAIKGANQYNGYLMENPGAKRIASELWNEMLPGAQNILMEVEKKEVKQGSEFDYPKVINQINGYLVDGKLTAEELNKLPKYEITLALAQQGGHNAMTFINLLPPQEKSSLSRAQLESIITQTAQETATKTIEAQLEKQKEQEKLGYATRPEQRKDDQSPDTVYNVDELYNQKIMEGYNGGNSNMPQGVLAKKINKLNEAEKQIPKYEKKKRETKREKKAKENHVQIDSTSSIDYLSGSGYFDVNTGVLFRPFRDKNLAFGMEGIYGQMPDQVESSYKDVGPFGIVNSGETSIKNYRSLGAAVMLAYNPFFAEFGVTVSDFSTESSTSQTQKTSEGTYSKTNKDSTSGNTISYRGVGGFMIPLLKTKSLDGNVVGGLGYIWNSNKDRSGVLIRAGVDLGFK